MLLSLLLGLATAHAAPDADKLHEAWKQVAEPVARLGRLSVTVEPADFEVLARGDVVKRLVPVGDLLAAQGMVWVPRPPENVWVTIQDPDHRNLAREDFPIERLPGSTVARRLNYQHVDTPWPMADRQQVYSVQSNGPLWTGTSKKVWERSLTLQDRSLATSPDPKAVWLEHLSGGFVLIEADGGTLAVMRVETDPGGNVPAEIVSRLTQVTMGGSLKRLVEYSKGSAAHYVAGHEPTLRPDGTTIPLGSLAP